MTHSEILERINQMRLELDILKSLLTPPKPKRTRKVRSYSREIDQYIKKINLK